MFLVCFESQLTQLQQTNHRRFLVQNIEWTKESLRDSEIFPVKLDNPDFHYLYCTIVSFLFSTQFAYLWTLNISKHDQMCYTNIVPASVLVRFILPK